MFETIVIFLRTSNAIKCENIATSLQYVLYVRLVILHLVICLSSYMSVLYMSTLLYVRPVTCPPCYLSALLSVRPVTCPPCYLSALLSVRPVTCPPCYLSALLPVRPVTCPPCYLSALLSVRQFTLQLLTDCQIYNLKIFVSILKQVQQSLDSPGQELRVPAGSGSQTARQETQKVVRLSALRTSRLYPQEIILVLISVRG